MLAQPKLLTWSAAKTRIINRLNYSATIHEEASPKISTLASRIPQISLFSSRSLTKFQFDTHLQAFTYYRSNDDDENTDNIEDIIITSLFYDDPKDPRSAVFVYFTSLTTGIIRRCLKYDFQFPSFQLLKYISRLELIVGYSNNRIYLLSNKNGNLKYLTSTSCPGTVRRIIYDRTTRSRDVIYVGGDKGLFVRWYLDRDSNGYELRLGDRLKSVFINREHNVIDMKLDRISHKLFIVGHKGCVIFDTLLNRESASVLSAHGAPVTCANIYGFSIIMGFSDGIMKIFEIGNESIPVRYQLQAHHAAMIGLLITTDGIIVTGAVNGTIGFYSLESLVKLGEHHFTESIERIMFVRGEDILVKFKNDLQLLTYTLPIRSFSAAVQPIEQLRVTFPVGSIPSRVVLRSSQNLFTVHNPRSTQIINVIPLSPNRIIVNDFMYDSAGEILYILTSKIICSYHCASQPAYLLNMFEVKDDCLFTKLCCVMWFSLLPEHTKKRRAFGIIFVGTTNGKLYLVPGDHGLKYALLPNSPDALDSYYQILKDTATVETLEIFQAYETYTTRGGARYLLAIGNDLIAKFYRVSISDHEIFLRELGVPIRLDSPCIGAAMAEYRIAIACALRGYIQMYLITIHGLDEISPKDILYEDSPIKSLTGCDTLGLFATLNNANEIILWTKNNEAIRKLKCDAPLISIANLNDRGDILLISNRRLYFLMISDFAPDQALFDLTKKTIKDDPIEYPVQINKKFDPTSNEPVETVQLNLRAIPQVPQDVEETDPFDFFQAIEQKRIEAEMARRLEEKKIYPIAPDGFIPNSTIRSMFKLKDIEPVDMNIFRLRLDILDNLENKTNKNLNWQNDDDEWVELGDPDGSISASSLKPINEKKTRTARPSADTLIARQKDLLPDVFKRLKKESWWKPKDDQANNNLRSMLLYLLEILKAKQKDSYESACNYVVEIFKTHGIDQSLVDQILDILINHLVQSGNDPLDVHTVQTIAQFMIERKNIVVSLLDFALKYPSGDILHHEAINAIKFITDVNNSDDIELVFDNMAVVRNADADTFSFKAIIERIKAKRKKSLNGLINDGNETVIDEIHPLLKKISEERWFPRDNIPITLDSIIDIILSKLPNASKSVFKALTTYLVQLHREIGYSKEQFTRVSNGIISLLSHADADYRLRAASVLAELGQETKSIDIALLNSFLNDSRVLVRTECCDTLKKLTGITSDTVLKDCADDIPILQTLPEENFSLQNYLKEKNRKLTTTDEQALVSIDEKQENETEEENIPVVSNTEQEDSNKNNEDTNDSSPINEQIDQVDDKKSSVHSRTPSPDVNEQSNTEFNIIPTKRTSPEPTIRIEITEKPKPTTHTSNEQSKARREPSPSIQPSRSRKQPSNPLEQYNPIPIKITVSDQSTGKRIVLLPNNTNTDDSYTNQNDNNFPTYQEQPIDPIQSIIDDHKRHDGYYRMIPKRPVLVPHKVSLGGLFGDQTHIIPNRQIPVPSTTNTMHLSDLNNNKRHLNKVEFVQLLSSLMIRAITLHRRHERLIPGLFSSNVNSSDGFTEALTISQMRLHSSLDPYQTNSFISNRLPTIYQRGRSSFEITRIKSDAQTRATREGINLHKVRDMEAALSNLLKTDSEPKRSRIIRSNTSRNRPPPPPITPTSDQSEITHAMVLEQILKSQGIQNPQNYIQQISRTYPKFNPLLYSRVPQHLISIIWNDPVMKHLASIISTKQDESFIQVVPIKSDYQNLPIFDDELTSNVFDYSASNSLLSLQQQHRDDHKKKNLPSVHGIKLPLPRHILKFGYREIDASPPETSIELLRTENPPKLRRRQAFVHLRCNHDYHSK
ncbi:unnamed protein product [Adineta steineri]|uniref:Uncharacterized protein n=1 Tax=Adineta steineri TaxID=433720 RepID=A0A813R7R2_9BILA|nr:unnamed protein product [Adineta steineri]